MFTIKTSGKILYDFIIIENYDKLQRMISVCETLVSQGKTLPDKQNRLYDKAKLLIDKIDDTRKYKFKGPESFQNLMREIIMRIDKDPTDVTELYYLCPEMKSILSSNPLIMSAMQQKLKDKWQIDMIFHEILGEFGIQTCYEKAQCRIWIFKNEMTDQFNVEYLWDYLLKPPDPKKNEEMISFANARIIGTLVQFLRNKKIKILKYEPTFILSKFGKLSPLFVATRLKAFPIDTILNDYKTFFTDIIDDNEKSDLTSFIATIPEDEQLEQVSDKTNISEVNHYKTDNNEYIKILKRINDILHQNSLLPIYSIEAERLFHGVTKEDATNFYNWLKIQDENKHICDLNEKRFISIRNLIRDKLPEYEGPKK